MKQTNMMKLIGVVGVTTATAFMGAGEAKAITPVALDLFEDADDTGQVLGGQGKIIDNNLDSNTVVNGFRAVEVTVGGNQTNADVRKNKSPAVFRLGAQNDGDQAVISYKLNGIDLIGDGNEGFLFENFTGIGDISVTLEDTSNQSSKAIASFPNFQSNASVFLDFGTDFNNSINFNSIDTAQLTVTATNTAANPEFSALGSVPDVNTSLENNGEVPQAAVPFEAETSIALAMLGTWGAWKYWRRKKQQQVNFDNSEA